MRRSPVPRSTLAALTIGALGVVFGDVGTSPLYALQVVYSLDGGVVRPTAAGVYGVVSLAFWAITLIASVKYIAVVSRTIVRVTNGRGMSRWRKRLYAARHNAADPIDYFGLPLERTIVIGSQIPLCR